jgi:hypothetical protein
LRTYARDGVDFSSLCPACARIGDRRGRLLDLVGDRFGNHVQLQHVALRRRETFGCDDAVAKRELTAKMAP